MGGVWSGPVFLEEERNHGEACLVHVREPVGGGVRIHPENARMSGRHGEQYVAQCVECAALAPVVWQ